MIKKTIILPFYLTSLWEKNILANLTNSQEPEPVGAGAGAAWKKPGAGAAWEKNQEPEPEPLEKKSGAGAGKKFAGSPALHLTHTSALQKPQKCWNLGFQPDEL